MGPAASASLEAHFNERHIVQFYEDESFLRDKVATFLGEGLVAGDTVVVIATQPHRAAFCERLRAHSIDVDTACSRGQLILLDAQETLESVLEADQPCRRRLSELLDRVAAHRPVRAFGEMVDLLWKAGQRSSALRLEEHWDELVRTRPLTLLCAYVLTNFGQASDDGPYAEVCARHGITLPTERWAELDHEGARVREVVRLQQQALALQSEIERRKRVEAELLATQRRLSESLEQAVVPIHFVAPDGTILWANQAELDLVGYARGEYIGKNIRDFHADPAAVEDMLARLSRGETLREYPARLVCKDGSLRHVAIDSNALFENGKLVHTRCFTRDMTARIHTEEALRQHQTDERMRLLVESVRDYAIFMLDASGRIATWNPGAQRIKGYLAHEIIGRHFSAFYPEEDVRAGKCEHELKVAAETGRFEDEGWRVRKDGSRFWANVVISAVRRDDGTLLGFSKVTRDLTDRVRAEEQRARLTAAEESNRAKDQFLAMLGHELRNPLAPIVTALQLMKLRGDVRSSKEHVVIERQVQHVVRLVDDLLDVSRITQGKIQLRKRVFELCEVVAGAIEVASPLLEQRRHRLTIEVPRQGMAVEADPDRLGQVITNLLTNAAKYTEVEGEIEVRAWRDGHEVVLQVKDNGVGIAADLLPHVFELFVQGARASDRALGGLGIGLTLVKNLVEMHHGTVVALSDGPGRGSAFVVRLPATAPLPVADPPVPLEELKSAATRRVLVVDDNVDAATLLGELCGAMGHDVRVAHDGAQALQLLRNFVPEVAVLDIGLPVMDGYELAKRVHEKLPGCRLIALTGYGQEHDQQRSKAAGFEAHLVKPVDPSRVLGLIDGPK